MRPIFRAALIPNSCMIVFYHLPRHGSAAVVSNLPGERGHRSARGAQSRSIRATWWGVVTRHQVSVNRLLSICRAPAAVCGDVDAIRAARSDGLPDLMSALATEVQRRHIEQQWFGRHGGGDAADVEAADHVPSSYWWQARHKKPRLFVVCENWVSHGARRM